jgi:hypothetical protein
MRRLLLLVIVILTGALAAEAQAAPSGAQHTVYSDNWQGTTFVTGLDACPLLGSNPDPYYVFFDVDLTDHINSTYTPIPPDDFLYQFDSVGSVHGVINAPNGVYHVSGGGIKEHRVDPLDPLYFSGQGEVTISGSRGTVTGQATFQDLLGFPPPEFDFFFTRITACSLK